MKRSEINSIIRRFEKLMKEHCFEIPPFLSFTPQEWQEKGHEYDEIRDNMLGWDVTDYGMGDYANLGLALITLRNGNPGNENYPKPYCEKIIMCDEGQVSPMHYHWRKFEDIINRGGNDVVFSLYNIGENDSLADTPITIYKDGLKYEVPGGEEIVLKPGESMSLYPGYYHGFVIPKNGKGSVLIGEVSTCNDDNGDNHFYQPIGRFPTIEEDEAPYRLLCNEYPPAK